MGACGPGIKQNDLFGDIYDTFRALYYDGLEPNQNVVKAQILRLLENGLRTIYFFIMKELKQI